MPEIPPGSVKYALEKLREPEGKDQIIAALHYDVTSAEWIIAPLHRAWYEAILWSYGEHYLEWNQRTRRFQIRPVRLYIPRSVTNLILPKVEIGVSMFLDSLPRARFVPTTPQAKDRDAAEAATGIMRYLDTKGKFAQKKRDLANWVVVCGTGYMQTQEDKLNAERTQVPRLDPSSGVQMSDENGEPVFDTAIMADEGCEVLSPFEVVPDWNARYPWEWRRYTHVRARSREWIGSVFGSEARDAVKPESASGTLGTMAYYQLKIMDIQMRASLTGSYGLPYGYGGAIADFRYMEDSAIIKTRWQLPSDKYPDGRLIIVAGSEVLEDGPNPFKDKLNLFTFRWSVLPGSAAWGFGMVRNLIPLQKRLNGIDTQTDLARKITGVDKILVERKTRANLDLTTSEVGHIITYNGRGGVPAPTLMRAGNVTSDAHTQREFILKDMEQIAGVPDVLRGDMTTGDQSGIALETLTERALKRYQPAVEENREEFKRLYELRIEVARSSNAWRQGREIPTVGANGRMLLRHFTSEDFTGNLTVDVEAVPITAFSEVFKKQTIKDLMATVPPVVDITNEATRDKVRTIFGLGELNEPVDVDRRQAQSENERMSLGEALHRQTFDNDLVHLEEHMLDYKSPATESQGLVAQQIKQAHIIEHQQAVSAQQQVQAQQAMAAAAVMPTAGGAPPGPGAPPPPAPGGPVA